MNLLQLVQRACLEVGLANVPSTVVNQTGQYGRMVNWVVAADQDIQNKYAQWDFLNDDVSFQTIAAQQVYTPTQAGCPELATWDRDTFRRWLTTTGVAGEMDLCWVDWPTFRDCYVRGSNRTSTGIPEFFAIQPDKSLILWPIPDAAYTVVGEYFKRAKVMTVDADEPLYPSQFHLLPVWMALESYGMATPAPESYTRGHMQAAKLWSDLELDQLPEMTFGEPLTS